MTFKRATIPMCPKCGAELEGQPFSSHLDWGWDCENHGFVTTGECYWGYHAPDVETCGECVDHWYDGYTKGKADGELVASEDECAECEKPEQWEALNRQLNEACDTLVKYQAANRYNEHRADRYLRACKRIHREWQHERMQHTATLEHYEAMRSERDSLQRQLDSALADIDHLLNERRRLARDRSDLRCQLDELKTEGAD